MGHSTRELSMEAIITDDDEDDNRSKLFDKWGRFVAMPVHLLTLGKYLTPEAVKMFFVINSFMNGDTGKTFPSYKAIMERYGTKRRQNVALLLDQLELFGWLSRQRHRRKASDYFLTKPDRVSPTPEEAKSWKQYLASKRKKKTKVETAPWTTRQRDRSLAKTINEARRDFDHWIENRSEAWLEVPYGWNGLEVPYGYDTN